MLVVDVPVAVVAAAAAAAAAAPAEVVSVESDEVEKLWFAVVARQVVVLRLLLVELPRVGEQAGMSLLQDQRTPAGQAARQLVAPRCQRHETL